MDDIRPPRGRQINRVTVLGPNLLEVDSQGQLLSPIATVFPKHRLLVTLRGIHATQVDEAVRYLAEPRSASSTVSHDDHEEHSLYEDAVSLVVRNGVVLIRSESESIGKAFDADEVLQLLVPKQCIQFTGIHLAEVRRRLRARGESWRISQLPRSVEEMIHHIGSSRASVSTGATYYQSAVTGERFLTYQEFTSIRPLLRQERWEALARLEEIVHLSALCNREGIPELSFLVHPQRSLRAAGLGDLITLLKNPDAEAPVEEAEILFDRFAASFVYAAGADLLVDSETYAPWRTAIFSKLFHIDLSEVEEWTLGVSPEFHLNVRWLPGAGIVSGSPVFEADASPRVRALIDHYRNRCSALVSVNLGSVESAQTIRDRSGEERAVYLATLGFEGGREEIRLLRCMKWDVQHRLKRGASLDCAIAETLQYRQYVADRLKAFSALGIPLPPYVEIELHEDIPHVGMIPVYFMDRPYVPGIVSEKIPPGFYARPRFVVRLAGLLGMSAAVSLVMGRACPRSGHIYFDDGDEVIQFDDHGLPERLVLAETTGSFTDFTTPLASKLGHCLSHLSGHLELARRGGADQRELDSAVEAFTEGLVFEMQRMQNLLRANPLALKLLYSDRSGEPGGIRHRWERILERLESTDPGEMRRVVAQEPQLTRFRMLPHSMTIA